MVIFISIIILTIVIVVITVLFNIFKNWNKLMNYKNLFICFIVGFIPLSVLLYFTTKNIWIYIGLYTVLIIISLFYGAFKKR